MRCGLHDILKDQPAPCSVGIPRSTGKSQSAALIEFPRYGFKFKIACGGIYESLQGVGSITRQGLIQRHRHIIIGIQVIERLITVLEIAVGAVGTAKA